MDAYDVPAQKITVIYEAASPHFTPQGWRSSQPRGSATPCRSAIFCSSAPSSRGKTWAACWRPSSELRGEGLTDALVIVGKQGWLYDDFFAQLERSPARDAVIFPGWVPDADLPAVYAGAAALAFPSEFEGFGLPVLEAMACGTPVVCSNTSSLPEVAGDAALLVDPLDTDAIAAALRRVLSEPGLSATLRTRGYAQAAKFSWDRTARETVGVYERVLAGQGKG